MLRLKLRAPALPLGCSQAGAHSIHLPSALTELCPDLPRQRSSILPTGKGRLNDNKSKPKPPPELGRGQCALKGSILLPVPVTHILGAGSHRGTAQTRMLLDPWARSEGMAGSGSTEVAHRDLPVTNRHGQAQHRQGHCVTCAAAMPSVAGWSRGAGGAQQGGPGCPKAQGLCAGSCPGAAPAVMVLPGRSPCYCSSLKIRRLAHVKYYSQSYFTTYTHLQAGCDARKDVRLTNQGVKICSSHLVKECLNFTLTL